MLETLENDENQSINEQNNKNQSRNKNLRNQLCTKIRKNRLITANRTNQWVNKITRIKSINEKSTKQTIHFNWTRKFHPSNQVNNQQTFHSNKSASLIRLKRGKTSSASHISLIELGRSRESRWIIPQLNVYPYFSLLKFVVSMVSVTASDLISKIT